MAWKDGITLNEIPIQPKITLNRVAKHLSHFKNTLLRAFYTSLIKMPKKTKIMKILNPLISLSVWSLPWISLSKQRSHPNNSTLPLWFFFTRPLHLNRFFFTWPLYLNHYHSSSIAMVRKLWGRYICFA